MTRKKVYKTNKGKVIDMEAMRIANERTVAAGNMKVNAKGDVIEGGKIVKPAQERVAPYYKSKKQVSHTSLKPEIKKRDAQENASPDIIDDTPVVKIRKRDDGSTYKEIMYADGSIEVEELEAASVKKKSKKTSKKKKPSI